MTPNLKQNIPLLSIYSVLIKRISIPIITLYYLLNNLNFLQIGIIASVTAIIIVVTEIHGGIFADIYGKRLSLVIHSVLGFLSVSLFFIGDSFYYFLLAGILYGLGEAFISGTRQSLMFETLKNIKMTKYFRKYNGRMIFFAYITNAIILLFVPTLYNYNVKYPFALGMAFLALSFIVALVMVETPIKKRKRNLLSYNKISEIAKEILSKKEVLYTVLLAMIVTGFLASTEEFNQPMFKIASIDVIYFGIIYAIMRVVFGLGSLSVHYFSKIYRDSLLLLIGIVAIILGYAGLYIGIGLVIVVSVILLNFAEGFNRIILEDRINRNIKSQNRTAILSAMNLISMAFNAFVIFFLGIAADMIGVRGMFIYVVISFVLAILIVYLVFAKFNKSL